ncbi:hypothetical protein PJWF_00037 [Achromobacter phage JWF]|uniref:tail protein n=1 Tax=Achromobacter phage JWF TaxID=1589748 RepID=UPI000588E611|nr:tail protein [Achromobacter phage JWF]AJD82931.1 hypothetical protein PJWF_00037 [Achromobacter phage JWF]
MRNIIATELSRAGAAQNAVVLAKGFMKFLDRHTGLDPDTGPAANVVINPMGIAAHNLQNAISALGWPGGAAWADHNVDLIQGYFFMWQATGDRLYFDRFLAAVDGYRVGFYAGQEIPSQRSIWRANYLLNSKRLYTNSGQTVPRGAPFDVPGGIPTPVANPSSATMGNFPRTDLKFAEILTLAYPKTQRQDHQAMPPSVFLTVTDFVSNLRDGNGGVALPYTPGAAPASLGASPRLMRRDNWSGMCDTAYQHPATYALLGAEAEYLNVAQMYNDSQLAYRDKSGILGPFATRFNWNRPDNTAGVNVWTMTDRPEDNAATFYGAARLWETMVVNGITPPVTLTATCQQYVTWLTSFLQANAGKTPNVFPTNWAAPSTTGDDATIAALHLSGVVSMARAGVATSALAGLMRACYLSIKANYTKMDPSSTHADMSGTIGPDPSQGYFFTGVGGIVLRALGQYASWATRRAPAFTRPVVQSRFLLESGAGRIRLVDGNRIMKEQGYVPKPPVVKFRLMLEGGDSALLRQPASGTGNLMLEP